MSYKDAIPCVSYERQWDPHEIYHTVQIKQYYDDKSVRKIEVPRDDGTRGIEFTINVTIAEFNKAAAKLTYSGQDMFENFDLCLTGTLEQRWKKIIRSIPNNQKTIPRFQRALQEFYQDWVGPGQRDVLRYWLEYGMKKPRSISPLDHSERLEELASLHNQLDGIHPEIDENAKKQIFLATHPAKFRTEYAKSAHDIYTDSYAEIVRYMTVLYELEKRGMFEDASENSENKNKRKATSDEDLSSEENLSIDEDFSSEDLLSSGKGSSSEDDTSANTNPIKKYKPQAQTIEGHIDRSKDCPLHPGKGHVWAGCRLNCQGNNFDPNSHEGSGRGAPAKKERGGNADRPNQSRGGSGEEKEENYFHEQAVPSKFGQNKTTETHHMDLIGSSFFNEAESSHQARFNWS
jgi:hypothetical protein